jgi:hypothetical protein
VSGVGLAIATCGKLPERDVDEELLGAAFAAAGVSARLLAWDDPSADFAAARACVLRSTWNYSTAPEAFAAWVEKTSRATRLFNPAPVVLWNMHKSYLLDLEAGGVPAVPTRLLRRGEAARLEGLMRELGTERVVVKPAVSGGSRETMRVPAAELERGQAHLTALLVKEDVLVQPYVASVESYGERAVVWIDGEPTHAVRKSPRFRGDAESVSPAIPIEGDEADLARRAIDLARRKTGAELLYGRIDMARDDRGEPRVMELELIEPSLFFLQSRAALDRFVAAVQRLL